MTDVPFCIGLSDVEKYWTRCFDRSKSIDETMALSIPCEGIARVYCSILLFLSFFLLFFTESDNGNQLLASL